MKILVQTIKYCAVWAICMLAALLISFIAIPDTEMPFWMTIVLSLASVPAFIAARVSPVWNGLCFTFRTLSVLFISLAACMETAELVFGEDIPVYAGILVLIVPILCVYLSNKKLWDSFFGKQFRSKKNMDSPTAPPKKSSVSTRKPRSNTPAGRTMSRVDKMDGHDFEQFVADLLRKLGYQGVRVTRGSGDQGVDILAVREGRRYAIQCKRYSSKLGNKPIQEVHTGKTIYNCQVAVVVTNNYFTPGAMEAARAVGVILWDRDRLQGMIAAAP